MADHTSKCFAIGDVHGCHEELAQLLALLPLEPDSTVVFLGDYVDRGPASKQVIQEIIDLRARCQVVALRGNHEAMMLDFIDHPESAGAALFVLNGGSATLASYSTGPGRFEIPPEHVQFLRELKLCHETESHFFVHAGVPSRPLAALNLDDPKTVNEMLWIRQPFLSSDFQWEKVIVHGHTPVAHADVGERRINLDTGCVYGHHLSALELTSGEIFKVDKISGTDEVFLRDQGSRGHEGQRIAHRFMGHVRVKIFKQRSALEFMTLNYNEFGLLIAQERKGLGPLLSPGEKVTGVIGEDQRYQVHFTGQVVRVQDQGDSHLFGIKIEKMQRVDDEVIDLKFLLKSKVPA